MTLRASGTGLRKEKFKAPAPALEKRVILCMA